MSRRLRTCRVSVNLTDHEKQLLERLVERNDLSLSRIVQEAVREFVKNHINERVDVLGSLEGSASMARKGRLP